LNWLKSLLVKPYWVELWDNCLKYVKRKGRGVLLETVQEHLVRGEVGGQQRFSALTLDKQGWDKADHLARFLWAVKYTNKINHEGVFFRRNVSDDEKEKTVWKVYTILVTIHSPSQISQKSGGTSKKKTNTGEVATELSNNTEDLETGVSKLGLSEDEPQWRTEALSRKRRLRLSCKLNIYNPTEPFWLVVKVNQVLTLSKPRNIPEAERLIEETHESEEDKDGIKKFAKDVRNNVFKVLKYSVISDFEAPLIISKKDDLIEITPEKLEELEQIQQFINNLDYQRENHNKACQNLGIEDPACPRLPGIVTSAVLKFWQPVGIWAIIKIIIQKVVQGALLADAVRLGKIW
ncbi:hypothetical protein BO71DRAFT_455871, partial [Aspergillus ellipticus CBS 707.79]